MRSRLTESLLPCALLLLVGCGGETTSAPTAAPSQQSPPKITHFYVSPGVVPLGDEATLCYGVENADTVSLEPNLKAIKPGTNRCFGFAPEKTVVIKFIASGPGGEAHEELAVQVVPASQITEEDEEDPGEIVTVFVASQSVVPKGMPVTLCYAAEEADSVKIDPPVIKLEPATRCFTTRLEESTTFKITAQNGDRSHSRVVEVKVQ
jgi:hypothetical protein